MPNPQLVCDGTPGLNLAFILQAQDNSGNAWPASGSASIDMYNEAFLVSAGGDAFQIIPKITITPGQPTITATATFSLTDAASGVALPPISLAVDLVAPPNPAQKATQVLIVAGPTAGTGSGLTDPGTATIPVSLT